MNKKDHTKWLAKLMAEAQQWQDKVEAKRIAKLTEDYQDKVLGSNAGPLASGKWSGGRRTW